MYKRLRQMEHFLNQQKYSKQYFSYREKAAELKMEKEYTALKYYESSALNFIDKYLSFENAWYILYVVITLLMALICAGVLASNICDFKEQKAIYDNGNFTCITQYYDYTSLPQWNIDAKKICDKAERTNSTYFTKNDTFNNKKYNYIKEEYTMNLHPINTNQMWGDFLRVCENSENSKLKIIDAKL